MLFLIKSKSHSSYFLYIYDVVIFDLRNICCNLRLIILNICQILMHLIFCYTKFKSGAYLSHLEVYAKLWRGVSMEGLRSHWVPAKSLLWGPARRAKPPGSSWILADLTTYKIVFQSLRYSHIQGLNLCSRLFRSSVSNGRPYGFFFLIIILYPTYFLPNA